MIKLEDKLGNILKLDASGITMTPYNEQVTINGNLHVTKDVTGTGGNGSLTDVSLMNHVHAQPNDSHGDAEQDTNLPKRAPI